MSLNQEFEWRSLSMAGMSLELRRVVRELNQRMIQLTTPAEIKRFRENQTRTTTQITIFTEEFDTDGPGWQTSGRQEVITDSQIVINFVEYTGSGSGTVHASHKYDKDVFIWRNAWAFDDTSSSGRAPFQSFTDEDATPDVDGAVCWRTLNTSPTTITRFDHANNDDGLKHLFILLIDDANTTIDFSQSTLEGNQGVSWTAKKGDMLLCVRGGGTSPVTSCIVPAQSVVPAIPEVKGGSVSAGNVTTTVVTHGMAGTPNAVVITPANQAASDWEDGGLAGITPFVSAITSTTFTIDWDGTLTAGTNTWYWTAVVN